MTDPTHCTVSADEAMVRAFLDAHGGDLTAATTDWRKWRDKANAERAREIEAAGNWASKIEVKPSTPAERAKSDRLLADGFAKKPAVGAVGRRNRDAAKGRRYALAALEGEARAVASAPEGVRNYTLNSAAWSLARPELGGLLDPDEIEGVLVEAAQDAGLPGREARTTVRSAFRRRNGR